MLINLLRSLYFGRVLLSLQQLDPAERCSLIIIIIKSTEGFTQTLSDWINLGG